MKNVLVCRNTMIKKSISMLSLALCISVISSCGSSKSDKKETPVSPTTTTVDPRVDGAPTPAGRGTIPTTTGSSDGENVAPTVSVADDSQSTDVAAPLGRSSTGRNSSDGSSVDLKDAGNSSEAQNQTIDFKQDVTNKTGGQSNGLSFTSAADDGLMKMFKANSTMVSKEQQTANLNLAQSIVGAKFIKNSIGGDLELAISEAGEIKFYKLSAKTENNKMTLTGVSATGQSQFQGGYLKCLSESCEESYAKIKFSGAYARIIFRTVYAHNRFGLLDKNQGIQYNLWKTYITNTVQGASTDARIEAIRMASYEVLNGKSALGVQILTENNEAVSFNMLLVAPEKGTEVNNLAKKVIDLSTNYDLPSTKNKKMTLSNAVTEVKLLNNNGRGEVKLGLSIDGVTLPLILQRNAKELMTPAQIKDFESKLAPF